MVPGCVGAAMVLACAVAVTVPQAQLAQEHRRGSWRYAGGAGGGGIVDLFMQ
jgi:hypothetical protein